MNWTNVNPRPNEFDFGRLDEFVAAALDAGQDILYTLFATPGWASSDAGAPCGQSASDMGVCFPPGDLNPGGSGPDPYWKTFRLDVAGARREGHG